MSRIYIRMLYLVTYLYMSRIYKWHHIYYPHNNPSAKTESTSYQILLVRQYDSPIYICQLYKNLYMSRIYICHIRLLYLVFIVTVFYHTRLFSTVSGFLR